MSEESTDSVYIFQMSSSCKIQKYGYARNEDSEILIVKCLQTSVSICYNNETKGLLIAE